MIVELGGGLNPRRDVDVVIDLHHPKRSPPQDAACTPWEVDHDPTLPLIPTDSTYGYLQADCVDIVYASHFLEHVPAGEPRIRVFNEAWRVLKPGGRFDMRHPLVGYTDHAGNPQSGHIGWQPWADPTHVSYWWFPESLLYLCEGAFKPCADYGVNTWAPLGPWTPDPFSLPQGGWYVVPGHDLAGNETGGWEGVASLIKG